MRSRPLPSENANAFGTTMRAEDEKRISSNAADKFELGVSIDRSFYFAARSFARESRSCKHGNRYFQDPAVVKDFDPTSCPTHTHTREGSDE